MMPGLDIGGIGPSEGFSGFSSTADSKPFQTIDATDVDDAKVRVISGLVNDLDPVDDGPFSAADDPALTLVVADADKVYLEITKSESLGV